MGGMVPATVIIGCFELLSKAELLTREGLWCGLTHARALDYSLF